MADKLPPPPPKPTLDDKGKDLESDDRLGTFEIQQMQSSGGQGGQDTVELLDDLTDKPPNLSAADSVIAMDDTPGSSSGGPGSVRPDKAPDGPQSPSPSPDSDTVSGGGGSDGSPGTVVFQRTDGDDGFDLGTDIFDLDADPDEGGEVVADPDSGPVAMDDTPGSSTGGPGGVRPDKAPDGPQSPSPSPDSDTVSGGGGSDGSPGTVVFQRTDGDDGFDLGTEVWDIDPEFHDRDHRGGELRSSDPEEGGEITMPPRPVTMTADDLQSSDPDDGGEAVPDFGAGAMPPRPVTMTAQDLGVAEDPDAGGEVVEDPDAGGEIFLPTAAVGGEDVFTIVAPTFDEVEPAAPEPELTDFEMAADFDQASHTLAPEEG